MVRKGERIGYTTEEAIKGKEYAWKDEYGEYHTKKNYWHCGVCNKKFIARRDAQTCEDLHNAKCSICGNPATVQIILRREYFCDKHYNNQPIYAKLSELRDEHQKRSVVYKKEVD